jgi:peroxiredoxin
VKTTRLLTLLFCLGAAIVAAPTLPRRSPEFVVKFGTGELLLSQFKGKLVLLSFMYTTCPHCQNSVRHLNAVQREYGPRGFQVIGAAFDQDAAALVGNFNRQFRPEFPVGLASRLSVLEYLQHKPNEPLSVPIFVFVDKEGMIRQQYVGDGLFEGNNEKARATIESLLGRAPAPKKAAASKKAAAK